MAYMSEAGERVSMQPWGAQGWDRQAEMSSRAIREAARILAVVEPEEDWADFGQAPDAVRPLDRFDGFAALADALAAVLPVLDELARNASDDLAADDDRRIGWMARGFQERNRATLAAMGAGGR